MAITITFIRDSDATNPPFIVADVLLDNNYPAGGYVLNAGDMRLKDIHHIDLQDKGLGNRLFAYDYGQPNGKLKAFTALGAEAAGASDQSTITVRVKAIGPHV